jgi:hypothetical protein
VRREHHSQIRHPHPSQQYIGGFRGPTFAIHLGLLINVLLELSFRILLQFTVRTVLELFVCVLLEFSFHIRLQFTIAVGQDRQSPMASEPNSAMGCEAGKIPVTNIDRLVFQGRDKLLAISQRTAR